MRKGLLLALLASSVSVSNAYACDIDGKEGIVEENSLNISVNAKNKSNVTEADFNTILDRVESIYSPIIDGMGKSLVVRRKWEDGTVNAYAQQSGNSYIISMFGGLARHETITADAFALVACHEIGHHLAGAPKKSSWFGTSWASNEGQADYWGTMKCLRKYFETENNQEIIANMQIDPYATKVCQEQFVGVEEIAMCQRASMAGLSLGNLFRALRNLSTELKFQTPDQNVVARTNHNHPAPQCRVDTYFAGAICERDAYEDTSNEDANVGVCNREIGDSIGVRPLCWYKPTVSTTPEAEDGQDPTWPTFPGGGSWPNS